MKSQPIYTIGHSTRKAEKFLELLNKYDINYLIDVRSIPYSRWNPQYNQNKLRNFLEQNKIEYIFMGDQLGGRPKDITCYDRHGKINYEMVKTKDFFVQGIDQLQSMYNKNSCIALMCSEGNPCNCHRSKLIGQVLHARQILMQHIGENGKLKDHTTVMNELHQINPPTLFGDSI